ncbi:hypothetical protein BHM03_00052583 [Ensete ventricosum]|nr:hypothetical protein BHM03_00052583 [Ensete ventricosum]
MIGLYLVLSGLWFHIYAVDLGGLAKELQAAAKSKTNWEKDEMRPRGKKQTETVRTVRVVEGGKLSSRLRLKGRLGGYAAEKQRDRGEDFSNGLIAAEGCRGRSTEEEDDKEEGERQREERIGGKNTEAEEEEGGGLSDGGSGGRGERRGGRHISGERGKRRYRSRGGRNLRRAALRTDADRWPPAASAGGGLPIRRIRFGRGRAARGEE